ncbi:MAG: ATP-binding protein [Phycisphaerae bacterium]
MATLHVLQGPDKGRTYPSFDEAVVIGRHSDQITLTDDSASRRHAELHPNCNSWILTDLNSSNGTYVNGRRLVSPTPLKHGDQIKVGCSLLVFSGQDAVEGFAGPHGVRDLVDLERGDGDTGSSILSAVAASDDSVILQPPETADAVAAWNVVYKIAEMIGTIESVDAFVEHVADIVLDHLIVDRLVVLMRPADGEEPTAQVVRYRTKRRGRRPKIVTSHKIIKHVLDHREGVLCANAMTDDRFGGDSSQDSIHRLGLRSVMCVPIPVRDDVYGVIHLDCSMSHHTYTQEQLRLVVAIGRLTGMAIENTRLLESRVRTERLAATGETVAYLSHHIRNILQGLQSGAEAVELGIRKGAMDTVRSGWAIVRRNLDRTLHLTTNMLTFSKDRRPRIETIQLNQIVREVLDLAQPRADERGVMLLSELEELPAIPLDQNGMHQVVHNVVVNAIEASPPLDGRVNIATTYDESAARVLLSISDNGGGIGEEHRERIFDAFHSSKGQGGTGLGLAAARKIVTELGGVIDVDTAPGEGTTFHIKLPAVQPRYADSDKTHGPR